MTDGMMNDRTEGQGQGQTTRKGVQGWSGARVRTDIYMFLCERGVLFSSIIFVVLRKWYHLIGINKMVQHFADVGKMVVQGRGCAMWKVVP